MLFVSCLNPLLRCLFRSLFFFCCWPAYRNQLMPALEKIDTVLVTYANDLAFNTDDNDVSVASPLHRLARRKKKAPPPRKQLSS